MRMDGNGSIDSLFNVRQTDTPNSIDFCFMLGGQTEKI